MINKKPGFTLIELLVVIAIIAVLIAILMPALRSVKRQAQSVLCASNIRQLSLGFTMYQQDYKFFPYGIKDVEPTMVPPPDRYPGFPTHDKLGIWWFNYLQDVLGIELERGSALWCPSKKETLINTKYNILCSNYGVNRSICKDAQGTTGNPFKGTPLRFSQIRNPASTFLIGDSGYSLISWQAAMESSNPPFENPMRVDSFYVPGLSLNETRAELWHNSDARMGRHPSKKINLGFVDGHMEKKPADSLEVKKGEDDSYNIPPIWTPN